MAITYHPPPTRPRQANTAWESLRSVDIIRKSLLIAGVTLIVTALTWGGNVYPWSSPRVITMLAVGAVLLVAFGVYG